mgnify:CR=1 FL=1
MQNDTVLFDQDLNEKLFEAKKISSSFLNALDNNEISVFYQPKIDLTTLDNVELVGRLLNGQTVIADLKNGDYRLYKDGQFVAIATCKSKHIKMSKYFKV